MKSLPMSPYQLIVVALCTLISALDGFDVLVVAFTAPVLSKEWGLGPADVGLLFSAGLIGMGLGALFVAPMGDWIGRRRAVIVCLGIMAVGMVASGYATSHQPQGADAAARVHRPGHGRDPGQPQHPGRRVQQ
jgi:MFS family permease